MSTDCRIQVANTYAVEVKFSRETWILALICTIDMISTSWLLTTHAANEFNPVMSFYVKLGIPTFVLVKTLLFFGPLYVLEFLRIKRPLFIRRLLRAGIIAYLIVYVIGVAGANANKGGWRAATLPQKSLSSR